MNDTNDDCVDRGTKEDLMPKSKTEHSDSTNCSQMSLFKIQDGFGTTRAYQQASDEIGALVQYAISVRVVVSRLIAAGWRVKKA